MKILMPVANQEVTISRDCAQKKKKMKDLKTTTHDESLMFVYKDFGTSHIGPSLWNNLPKADTVVIIIV